MKIKYQLNYVVVFVCLALVATLTWSCEEDDPTISTTDTLTVTVRDTITITPDTVKLPADTVEVIKNDTVVMTNNTIVVVPTIPVGSSCDKTFADDPACFCNDPANADDANCALINANGNGDFEGEAVPEGTGSPLSGGFWDLWGARTQDAEASAVYSTVDLSGNKALMVEIEKVANPTATGPWAFQAINEPSDDTDNGFTSPEGKNFLISADIFASKDGMKVLLTPGNPGPDYGAIDANIEAQVLNKGWNHVTITASHQGKEDKQALRGEIGLNYIENEGEILIIDNYKIIATTNATVVIPESVTLFSDALDAGGWLGGWGTNEIVASVDDVTPNSGNNMVKTTLQADGQGAFQLGGAAVPGTVDTYTTLKASVFSKDAKTVKVLVNGFWDSTVSIDIPAGQWTPIEVDIATASGNSDANFADFHIQPVGATSAEVIYVDDVSFVK